jgi:hypothetical protein
MPIPEEHIPQEDAPYGGVNPFALADDDNAALDEEDQTIETELIREIRAYVNNAIAEHNSFDVINMPQNAKPEEKVAVFDEMFNHKGLVHHLRQINAIIDNKVKEN